LNESRFGLWLSDSNHLQPLIEQYGAERVWKIGIETLGYPPSWAVGLQSALQIQDALEERFGER